jgi:hypothetical protein
MKRRPLNKLEESARKNIEFNSAIIHNIKELSIFFNKKA